MKLSAGRVASLRSARSARRRPDHRARDAADFPGFIVYGCGTQGRAIIEFLRESSCYPDLRLTDDDRHIWGSEIFFAPVQPPLEAFANGPHRFVCAIGDNGVRRAIFRGLTADGHLPDTVRHPAAIASPSACIGEGSILMARAVVDTEAQVGEGCLLNTASAVAHHCEIGNFVHLAPGVMLGGGVKIGDRALLGLGAVVLPGLAVGKDAIVGAGAVVIRDVPEGATVAGNPAKALRLTPSR
ncbi:MAG: acetyltransferase [Bryobacterales bacterium]|nr:acetyltransferase [Bryobacterales bacterium]